MCADTYNLDFLWPMAYGLLARYEKLHLYIVHTQIFIGYQLAVALTLLFRLNWKLCQERAEIEMETAQ